MIQSTGKQKLEKELTKTKELYKSITHDIRESAIFYGVTLPSTFRKQHVRDYHTIVHTYRYCTHPEHYWNIATKKK